MKRFRDLNGTMAMSAHAGRHAVFHWRQTSIMDVYQLICGALLFAAPWVFAYARTTSTLEARATGLAVMAISLLALVGFAAWEEWINVLLGAWLIAAPWALGFTHTTAMHVSIGAGLVIAYLALLDLWLVHEGDGGTPGEQPRPH